MGALLHPPPGVPPASLLSTLTAGYDLGDRWNKWGELLRHLLDNVHCRDLAHLDLNWFFTLLEPLDLPVHSGSSSHQDSTAKVDQVKTGPSCNLHNIPECSAGFKAPSLRKSLFFTLIAQIMFTLQRLRRHFCYL